MIRKATIKEAKHIQAIVNAYADTGDLLPLSLNEIFEYIRDFSVFEKKGGIVGVVALHVKWEDLAEIRSLAVKKEHMAQGIGKLLVNSCLREASSMSIEKVFTLTYIPEFFKKLGFHEIEKSLLPQKVWSDCLRCAKFPECDEEALIFETENQDHGTLL